MAIAHHVRFRQNRGIGPAVRLVALVLFLAVIGWPGVEPAQAQPVQPLPPLGDPSHTPNRLDPDFVPVILEKPLRDYLAKAPPDELIPVMVIMESQLTDERKTELLTEPDPTSRKSRKQRRREALIRELEGLQGPQNRIINFLKQRSEAAAGRGDPEPVRSVRRLWLVNLVGFRATKDVIEGLGAAIQADPEDDWNVRSIHLDLPRAVRGATQIRIAPGVEKIGADKVWEKGYDGSGVVVAIVDSGVDYDHKDLVKRMWVNPGEDADGDGKYTSIDDNGTDDDVNGYRDDVIGWDFSDSWGDPPGDETSDGHGTHVAGTVAGDGSSGIMKTGVAPGAFIMALKDGDRLSNEQAALHAMQYALGLPLEEDETETVVGDHQADIVNYSSGFSDDDPRGPPAYEEWRRTVERLMDAGVLFVTTAHNDRGWNGSDDDSNRNGRPQAPYSIRTPGRVPFAVTVGATDQEDRIASFSNRGPVTWQGVSPFFDYPWPPGLLKPDVCAPGKQVYSTKKSPVGEEGQASTTMSGTSMAAPHAAGVAALLLQKNPDLSAYELKYLLEETAVDLISSVPTVLRRPSCDIFACSCAGPLVVETGKSEAVGKPGPDNVFGWGRIDAQAAIDEVISGKDWDLSVKGRTLTSNTGVWVDNDHDGSPDQPIPQSDNYLYARVQNLGGGVVGNVRVTFDNANLVPEWKEKLTLEDDAERGGADAPRIGTYVVPLLGPVGSKHDTANAVVRWRVQDPPREGWRVVVEARALSPPDDRKTDHNPANDSTSHTFTNFVRSTVTGERPAHR